MIQLKILRYSPRGPADPAGEPETDIGLLGLFRLVLGLVLLKNMSPVDLGYVLASQAKRLLHGI